ncbi:thioredoxin fold domain-containing protein [Streptococcus lutetiensis]|uniref:thioredoxin fold domain-containing protein n=1 Tax=Streptococcus lutetiensis TaxID=150055 RepID=UPI001966450D|nr:thioredoxin fold domain-containing protein [Streptococcus lutetiensis]
MKKNVLKTTIFLSAAILSMATVSAFADDELVPKTEVTEVVDNTVENVVTDIIEPSNDIPESQSEKADEIFSSEVSENSEVTTESIEVMKTTAATSDEVEEAEVTIPQYEENVADFNQVPMADVYSMFTEDGKEHVIYFGRPTCYYCRQFSPELKDFNTLMNNRLEYYNTDSQDFDEAAVEFVFVTIGIPGTPTIIRLQNGQIVSAWIGGGISGQELYDYLFYGKIPAAMAVTMAEQSSEDDTETIAFEAEETKTDSNVQNVIFSSQDDVKTAEKSSSVPESSQDFSKKEIKTNNSNTLPKLGIKTNNFSVYGLLISLLGIILMKFSKGKINEE